MIKASSLRLLRLQYPFSSLRPSRFESRWFGKAPSWCAAKSLGPSGSCVANWITARHIDSVGCPSSKADPPVYAGLPVWQKRFWERKHLAFQEQEQHEMSGSKWSNCSTGFVSKVDQLGILLWCWNSTVPQRSRKTVVNDSVSVRWRTSLGGSGGGHSSSRWLRDPNHAKSAWFAQTRTEHNVSLKHNPLLEKDEKGTWLQVLGLVLAFSIGWWRSVNPLLTGSSRYIYRTLHRETWRSPKSIQDLCLTSQVTRLSLLLPCWQWDMSLPQNGCVWCTLHQIWLYTLMWTPKPKPPGWSGEATDF